MKNLSISMFVIVLLSGVLVPVVQTVQGLGLAELVLTSVYWGTNPMMPLTVQPGDQSVTLSIVITNTGDDYARSIAGTLRLSPPFIYEYSSDSGVKQTLQSITSRAGDLAPGQSFTFQYILSIDRNAEEIKYRLTLELTYRGARELGETTRILNVNVPIWSGELHIHSVTTTPVKVFAGSKQVALRVFIVNTGRGAAKNVKVYVNPQNPFKTSSTGSDQAFVGTIQPNTPSQVQFLLDVSEDAEPRNYPLELKTITEGSNQTTIGIIDFVISEKTRFAVLDITPENVRAGDSGVTVQVTVRNNGHVKAESVRIQLRAGNYFSGTLSDLLGTMNPGETKTAFFTLDVDGKATPQRYTADLRLDWTQDDIYRLNDTLPLNIIVKETGLPLSLIVIGVIVGFLIFGYLSRRRRAAGEEKPTPFIFSYLRRLKRVKDTEKPVSEKP